MKPLGSYISEIDKYIRIEGDKNEWFQKFHEWQIWN